MKGTVYSGIVYMPDHPDADLHGLIRVVIRLQYWLDVCERLGQWGLRVPSASLQTGIWCGSLSHVEQQVTERHYGELLACPLALQYTTPDAYKPIPKSLLRGKRNAANAEQRPRSGMPPEKF